MFTAELTHRPETNLTAHDTYMEIAGRWQDYEPGITEERLGITDTSLDAVRLDRLRIQTAHKLFVMNETVQPGNNFKFNGAAEALRRKLAENPKLRRLYIGSAGNAGAALVAAAGHYNHALPGEARDSQGLQVIVETPANLVPRKRTLLTTEHSTIHPIHTSVEAATAAAQQKAENDPDGVFIHAYNDLDAIAGQGFVAKRAFRSLLALQQSGGVDPERTTVKVLVQRGGGSLLTGFACELYNLKQQGVLGDTVQLYQVRPQESVERYDGLHVSTPGAYAQTVIDNPEFVSGTVYIGDKHTSKATLAMGHTYYKPFEASGLAGIAGFYAEQEKDDPTIYLTVLSGANYSSETYSYFKDLPRREEARILGSLVNRQYVEADTVMEYKPPQGLNPCYYGRHPAGK